MTVTAPACVYFNCAIDDTVVTAGDAVQRRLRWQNCSEVSQSFDFTLSDSLGWGSLVSGSVTLAPEEWASAVFDFIVPAGSRCGVGDAITIAVRAQNCPTRVFSCTNHVFAQPVQSGLPSLVLTAGPNDQYFGVSAVMPGDLNGDGFQDLAVGATSSNPPDLGHASVYFGGPTIDNTPDVTFVGQNYGDAFGLVVAGAGDLNGDGWDDFAVSAIVNDAPGFDAGRVYVYFGGPAFDSNADRTFDGPGGFTRFGVSIDGIGDVSGDGSDDFLVGADFGSEPGRAYVYFGGPGFDSTPDLIVDGLTDNERFGQRVARAGDLNGDGWDDFLVGAPLNTTTGPDAGAVYAYFGGPQLDTNPDLVFYGVGGIFGAALAGTDLDGDGASEIVVGAQHLNLSAGRAYIYFGGALLDTQVDLVLESGVTFEGFGGEITAVGDLDGDGYGDLAIGGGSYDYYDPGRVWLYRGGPGMDSVCDGVLSGTAFNTGFGRALAGGRDVSGDGQTDILIAAPNSGRCYFYSSLEPITTAIPPLGSTESRVGIESCIEAGGGVRIMYALGPHAASATLVVFDVAGRRVRTVFEGRREPGRHNVSWDRLDERGVRVPRSIYLLRLRVGEVQVTRKIAITHP